MPMSSSSDIVHVATTDHRVLRSPRARTTEPDPAVAGPPLVLLNGDETGPERVESLGREMAIALMSEVRGLPDTPQVRRAGNLALSLLDQALADRPDDPVARRAKAQALALSGRLTEAVRLGELVLRSAPSYEQALDDCTSYAIELGNVQAALAPARQAADVNPWSAAFHERLAYLHLQRQDWGGALQESHEALRLNPFLRFARMFAVQCLLHQKDLKHAEEEFETLIKLNPSEGESLGRWFAAQRQNHGT
jgi:tetratricopeptide (TPR) repeat protein